jgi:hypothetical protein
MATTATVTDTPTLGWKWAVYADGDLVAEANEFYSDQSSAEAAGAAALGDDWPGTPDVDRGFTIVAEEMEPWHYVGDTDEPAFLNGWSNDDPDFLPLAFRLHEDGEVDLQGNISGGSTGVIFTLPAGYRPSATAAMVAFTSAGGACVIAIGTDGTVLATPAPSALLMAGQFFLDPPAGS